VTSLIGERRLRTISAVAVIGGLAAAVLILIAMAVTFHNRFTGVAANACRFPGKGCRNEEAAGIQEPDGFETPTWTATARKPAHEEGNKC
jgi:hypothetical protein